MPGRISDTTFFANCFSSDVHVLTHQASPEHTIISLEPLILKHFSQERYSLIYAVSRYVPPQRVLVLHHFGLKTGEDFAHFLSWSGIRYGFQGNYKSVRTFCRFNSKCSAVARLDLLGGQSRVPKVRAARGFLGACST